MNVIPSHDARVLVSFRDFFVSEVVKLKSQRTKDVTILKQKFDLYNYTLRRMYPMPKAKKSSSKTEFTYRGYANINITESLEASAEAYIKDDKNVWYDFQANLIRGLSIKVYFDSESESFKAVATDFNPESPNHGMSLAAYASDWYTAIAVLLYKHTAIAEGDWTSFTSSVKKKFG